MSTPLPIRIYRPLHRQCARQRPFSRKFSATSVRPARGVTPKSKRVDPVLSQVGMEHVPGKSLQSLQEEQLGDEHNLPDDIGLLPGTLVRAPHSKFIGFLSLKDLWYEWKWLSSKIASAVALFRFKRSISTNPKIFWGWWQHKYLENTAEEKYKHLYRSFAKGDAEAISEMCLSGVAKQFHDRLAARPRDLKMDWTADELNARVVSNRAQPLSLSSYENAGIHQIVFRVKSKQTLKITGKLGGSRNRIAPYTPRSGDVVEYLVLQRQFINGQAKHQDWMVWGFANESTLAQIKEDEEYERRVNAFNAGHAGN